MKSAGYFNLNEYLERLNEEAQEDGGISGNPGEGLIIPAENRKTYDWLKKEYDSAKTEVKVEMKLGGAKFEPGYDFSVGGDTVKDFKPGMYGNVKTSDTEGSKKTKKETNTQSAEPKSTENKSKEEGVKIKGASAGIAKKKKKKEKKEEDDK